jgi:hypothetical protein
MCIETANINFPCLFSVYDTEFKVRLERITLVPIAAIVSPKDLTFITVMPTACGKAAIRVGGRGKNVSVAASDLDVIKKAVSDRIIFFRVERT